MIDLAEPTTAGSGAAPATACREEARSDFPTTLTCRVGFSDTVRYPVNQSATGREIQPSGSTGEGEKHLSHPVLFEALAYIRAVPTSDLERESTRSGGSLSITSLEAVTLLVLVRDTSGVDPKSRDVVRECGEISTLAQVQELIDRRKEGRG